VGGLRDRGPSRDMGNPGNPASAALCGFAGHGADGVGDAHPGALNRALAAAPSVRDAVSLANLIGPGLHQVGVALPPLRANRADINGRGADAGGLARDQAVNGLGEPLAEVIGDMGHQVDVLTKGAGLFANLNPGERDAGGVAVDPGFKAVAQEAVPVYRVKVRRFGRRVAPMDRREGVQRRAVADGEQPRLLGVFRLRHGDLAMFDPGALLRGRGHRNHCSANNAKVERNGIKLVEKGNARPADQRTFGISG